MMIMTIVIIIVMTKMIKQYNTYSGGCSNPSQKQTIFLRSNFEVFHVYNWTQGLYQHYWHKGSRLCHQHVQHLRYTQQV